MKKYLSPVIIIFLFVILARIPVIPVSISPVLPDATPSMRMKTLQDILWFVLVRPEGLSYQWHWYTFAVISALLAFGCIVSVLVFIKIGGTPRN